MKSTHFITGATGFVGSAILIELLKQTQDHIYCLVRPKESAMPKERLFGLIEELIPAYHESNRLKIELHKRVVIVVGELSAEVLNAGQQVGETISHFWHVAASLNYEERYADQIFATNVEGTRFALQLAKKLNTQYFNYFSTAYVVGKREGLIQEKAISKTNNNNTYERSKVTAENEVLAFKGILTRIFRPSIVIGHSKSRHAFNFSGFYGFLRRLVQFKGMTNRIQIGYLDRNPVKMKFDPTVPINLVPIDLVAQQSVEIGSQPSEAQIFNLTNPSELTAGETVNTLFELAGLPLPQIVQAEDTYNWIDQKFNEKIDFYNSYANGNKIFDRKNTNNALKDASINPKHAITKASLNAYGGWYLKTLRNKHRPENLSSIIE